MLQSHLAAFLAVVLAAPLHSLRHGGHPWIAGITPRFTTRALMPRRRSQSELPGAAELYARLFAEQGGVCAICGHPPKKRRLHIDHNHRTGRVRGLLCFRCNRALPTYTDSEWLRRACEYVAMDEQAGVPDQWDVLR